MAQVDLPSRIKETIKEPHGRVNHLNTARIPLCLPPKVETPLFYTLGFARWAEIYLALEEVWNSLIGEDPGSWPAADSEPSYENDQERIQGVLRQIYLPELLRTQRLKADFATLRSLDAGIATHLDAGKGHLGSEFGKYIKEHIPTKPHLLVAYIWIMYQALFNGGRFIRMQLVKAGPEFWGLSAKELNPAAFPSPLSFWSVDQDEVVKNEFRSRVVKADKILTEAERLEILEESLEIFRRCENITLELDKDMGAIAN